MGPPLWHFPKMEMLTNIAVFVFPTTWQQCQLITTLLSPLLTMLPPPHLLSRTHSRNGPKDNNVIWAPGKFFSSCSLPLIWFNWLNIFHFLLVLIYNNKTAPGQWQWPLTRPWKHPQPLPWATAHRVGTCATTREQQCHHQTRWNDETTGDTGEAMRRRQSTQIKGLETSFYVSWAVGIFFSFSLHYFVTNKLF